MEPAALHFSCNSGHRRQARQTPPAVPHLRSVRSDYLRSDDDEPALPAEPARKVVAAGAGRRVLLVDLDPPIAALIEEWLCGAGFEVHLAIEPVAGHALSADLVLVDVPFPRQGGERLRALAQALPGAPILALSPTFFAGVAARGAVARELGVAGVLAKPVQCAALLSAVAELLGLQL
jgi:CheY-like chemotaxis protein